MSFSGRPQAFNDKTLVNDAFYPAINLGEFQKLHRIPTSIADDAVEHQLNLALAKVNRALAGKKLEWEAAGHSDLASVEALDTLPLQTAYRAAVFYQAKANMLGDFQTFSRRDSADNQAQEGEATHQLLMAEAREAMRLLKGYTTTITAELL